jgi:tetratricopeptide (TPR) repeat protein
MSRPPRLCLLLLLLCVSRQALSQSPPSPSFADLSQRASEALAQNRVEDAAQLYRQAVKLRPTWAEGWGYLAASLFTLNRFAEAEEAYRQTTVLTPRNGPSWAFLAFCQFERRDYRHAFDNLVKSQRLGLGDNKGLVAKVHYELALLWNTAGQFEMGMKELAFLTDANDQTPPVIEATGLSVLRMPIFPYEIPSGKHELIMQAGAAGWAMNAHHLEDSKQAWQEIIAAYPREPNVHYAYGYLLALLDQEAAVTEFEKELELSPNHVPALTEAAFLRLKMAEFDKSRQLASRAMKIEPRNYAPHNIMGRILMQTGDAAGGIQELETAARLAPNNASVHFNLAQAYQKAGKKEAAAKEFAAFRKLDQGGRAHEIGSDAKQP